jgi:trigger factor
VPQNKLKINSYFCASKKLPCGNTGRAVLFIVKNYPVKKMNISQEKIDSLNTVVKINLAPADYQPRVEKLIKEQAKKAKIPGFRPGMVPAAHIKKMYGKSILVDEINNLLSDTLNKYLEDEKLEVLGQPLPKREDDRKEYNWDFADDFEFNYEVGLARSLRYRLFI